MRIKGQVQSYLSGLNLLILNKSMGGIVLNLTQPSLLQIASLTYPEPKFFFKVIFLPGMGEP